MFVLVSLVPLAILTIWGCTVASSVSLSASGSNAGLDPHPNAPPVDSLLPLDESLGNRLHWRRRALQVALVAVIAMLLCVEAVGVEILGR